MCCLLADGFSDEVHADDHSMNPFPSKKSIGNHHTYNSSKTNTLMTTVAPSFYANASEENGSMDKQPTDPNEYMMEGRDSLQASNSSLDKIPADLAL